MTEKQIQYIFDQAKGFIFQPAMSIDQAEAWADNCEFTRSMRLLFMTIVMAVPVTEF